MGFFNKFFSKEKKETLDNGLDKTRQGMFSKLKHAIAGKSKIDDDVLDELEEVFVTSDVGVETTLKIIDRIQQRVARDHYVGTSELNDLLCDEITKLLPQDIVRKCLEPGLLSPFLFEVDTKTGTAFAALEQESPWNP